MYLVISLFSCLKYADGIRILQEYSNVLVHSNVFEKQQVSPIRKQKRLRLLFRCDINKTIIFNLITFIIGFDARWQPVNGTRHKFYVYSAYYDARTRPVIRVIGATKTKRSDKVWCRLHYGQSIEQKVSKSGNGNENGEDQEEEEMPPLLVPGGKYQLFNVSFI